MHLRGPGFNPRHLQFLILSIKWRLFCRVLINFLTPLNGVSMLPKVIYETVKSSSRRLSTVSIYAFGICTHLALSVLFVVPIWLLFFISTRIVRLIVNNVPCISRNYRWMSSSDALFFIPGNNLIDTDDGPAESQPYITSFAVFGGKMDGDVIKNRFAEYFKECLKEPCDDSGDSENKRGSKIDEDTRKMFMKLMCYPVEMFGYVLWKRDHQFDVNWHIGPLKRYLIL